MSWGLTDWGLGLWGVTPELSIVSAVAVTTHSVLVTLSNAAVSDSPIGPGDALNPSTWIVARDDDSYTWTVIGVLEYAARRYQLFLRTALQSVNRVHEVRSTTLRTPGGLLVIAPYEVAFRGVLASTAVNEPEGPSDFLTTDALYGGLRTTEAGSYARIWGDDVIRKMVYRRLVTMPGSYFHIPEGDFGVGLKIKEPIRGSSLPSLKVRIELELLKEPGVIGAKVGLESIPGGGVTIHARVQTQGSVTETTVTAS